MTGAQHAVIGCGCAAAAMVAAQHFGVAVTAPELVAGVALAAGGSLVPDIDHGSSWASIGIPAAVITMAFLATLAPLARPVLAGDRLGVLPRLLPLLAPVARLGALFLVLGLVWLVAGRILRLFVRHRGATHSIVVGCVVALALAALLALLGAPWWLGLTFGLGWVLHSACDRLSSPVPGLLWPLA